MNKGQAIFWGVVVVIGLGVGGYFGVRSMIRASAVKPFKEHVEGYLKEAKPAGGGKPGEAPALSGKIGSKVITVDTEAKEIDYVYFDLPDEMRAKKPDEVDTVVQLKWSKMVVGHYNNDPKKPGEKYLCFAAVIDKGTWEVTALKVFEGSDPPKSVKSSSGGATGSKPTEEIATWLKSLPKK